MIRGAGRSRYLSGKFQQENQPVFFPGPLFDTQYGITVSRGSQALPLTRIASSAAQWDNDPKGEPNTDAHFVLFLETPNWSAPSTRQGPRTSRINNNQNMKFVVWIGSASCQGCTNHFSKPIGAKLTSGLFQLRRGPRQSLERALWTTARAGGLRATLVLWAFRSPGLFNSLRGHGL